MGSAEQCTKPAPLYPISSHLVIILQRVAMTVVMSECGESTDACQVKSIVYFGHILVHIYMVYNNIKNSLKIDHIITGMHNYAK